MQKKTHKLFVYGTLKKGFKLHKFLEGSKYLGETVVRGFELLNLGAFPGMMVSEIPDNPVHGELYEVDAATLSLLDKIEGTPHLYRRVLHLDGFYYYLFNGEADAHLADFIVDGIWR